VVRDIILWTILLVLASIVLVFVSPAADIAPAALHASQAASVIALLLMMAATMVAPLFRGTGRTSGFYRPANRGPQDRLNDLLILNCSLIC
jgi:hypothetical protein